MTDIFQPADFQQSLQHFRIPKLCISQDRASTLNRLDDFVRHVAGQGETGGVGIYFHGTSQCLLSTGCHPVIPSERIAEKNIVVDDSRISFIEDDDLMSSRRQCDLSLRKRLDLVSDDIDTSMYVILSAGRTPYKGSAAHLSSLAFNSRTPSLYASPSRACARE